MSAGPLQPKQARSRATQQRLLEATIQCIVELGYASSSTSEICRRAGVSQGALFKHFPSKAALFAAATEHLFAGLVGGYRQAFAQLQRSSDPLRDALNLLWGVFTDDPLQVAFELYIAARTDPELRDVLAPVLRQHRENLRREAAILFPQAAGGPELEEFVDGIMATLQGAAISRLVLRDPEANRGELAFVQRVAHAELARIEQERADESAEPSDRGDAQ